MGYQRRATFGGRFLIGTEIFWGRGIFKMAEIFMSIFRVQFFGVEFLIPVSQLKYVSKICGLHLEIVAVARPCIRFFHSDGISKL